MDIRVHFLALGALILAPHAVSTAQSPGGSGGPTFTLNGKALEPRCRTLKSLGIDSDEVLISLEGLNLILDPAAAYAFTGDTEKDGRLYLDVGGTTQLVGLIVFDAYDGADARKVDPFAGLRPADMRHVRGVCLDQTPSGRGLELLGHADPARIFFRITDEAAVGGRKSLPGIPQTARFLEVRESSSDGIKDYGWLKSSASLVFLRINSLGGVRIDAKAVANHRNLACLDLSGEHLDNLTAIGQLGALRHLDLSWCEDLTDLGFLRGLTRLEELNVSHARIEDLTPLQEIGNIARVNANLSPVKRLPAKPAASLRQLRLVGTLLTEGQVAAFQKAHPQCQVYHGWAATLDAALAGVDRIRVRSGGTCHRNPETEKTLFEIVGAGAVREVVAGIKVEPPDGMFCCMCCGDPSFEFYRRGKLAVTLGFHHGQSLRWMDGEWPGDVLLSPAGGDFLCEWLARHGVTGPLEKSRAAKKRQEAAEDRMAVYEAILPEGITRRLEAAESAADALKAFVEGEPDKARRVALALKLIGSHSGSWNRRDMLDPVALALLGNEVPSEMPPGQGTPADLKDEDKISTSDIVAAFKAHRRDAMVTRGAARWFLGEGKPQTLPREAMEDLLPAMVEAGMTHPRQVNRRRTLEALKEINNPLATKELAKVLAGKFKVKSLGPEEEAEPDGWVSFKAGEGQVGADCSDAALAALILAKLGNTNSLPAIRSALESEQKAESRKVLREAVRILGGHD